MSNIVKIVSRWNLDSVLFTFKCAEEQAAGMAMRHALEAAEWVEQWLRNMQATFGVRP